MAMTDDEILARIEEEERVAYGINDDSLANERAKAISYYLGEPLGNEVEGRSQVVSFDVQDTVEAALPQLIKIFTAGDQVVRFDPKTPDDEEAAEQETEYINHVVMERNNGFEVIYTWFKDALLSKNGYVKIWHEKEYETESEFYKGLTDAQLTMLVKDEDVTVVEHDSYIDNQAYSAMMEQYQTAIQQYQEAQMVSMQTGQQIQEPPPQEPQPPILHDVKIEITKERGCVKIKNVAPENIMVSVDCPGLKLHDARFVQHRESGTIEELREQGFKIPDDVGYSDTDSYQVESNARDLYNEQYDRSTEPADNVLVRDTYIKIDGKRMRYVVVGNAIVYHEEVDCVPFACITPMLMPHRHIGRSYADLTMDIQLVKTALIRGQLDNMYLSNNGRYAISDRVNLEDMLTSRPGGVVRVQGEPSTAILPLQHTPFPPTSFTMVEYLDTMKEKRTGVTAYNQGLDADSLNKTATGINAIMQASAARLELVARLFAETGVKDLFLLVHKMIRQNFTKPDIIRLRNKWVEVDPRQWKTRTDMTINVGIGTGSKDQQLQHLITILQAQKEAIQLGIATPSNIYNALIRLTQNAGFKHPEEFWTDPALSPPPEPQKPVEVQVEEIRQQGKIQEFQAKAVIEKEKANLDAQQEMLRSKNDVAIERDKLMMQAELEKYKADLQAKVMLEKAKIDAQAKTAIEEHKAKNAGIVIDTKGGSSASMTKMTADFGTALNSVMERSEKNQRELAVAIAQAINESMNRPKTIVRDSNGRAVGVQ